MGDADFFERVEFFEVVFDRADEAEAVDDFVADEIGVVAADFAVVMIVVGAFSFDEGRERCGEFFGLVFGDEIHHVIRNESGEPADAVAGEFEIVGSPDGGGGHDFDLAEVAAGFFGAFADEAEAPGDQIGIGKLEDDAVADAAGGAQGFRAVAGDPDGRHFFVGPRESCGDAVVVDRLACV